ncbi:hypothetical protein HZ326_0100 [Fusarium oxysporum f. sp. albedinis]|nr:hypothetical protein HZ326_0100 [Fusarium oxysporum f. sp. albedinis]
MKRDFMSNQSINQLLTNTNTFLIVLLYPIFSISTASKRLQNNYRPPRSLRHRSCFLTSFGCRSLNTFISSLRDDEPLCALVFNS